MADNEYTPRGKSSYRGEMCANSFSNICSRIYMYSLPIKRNELKFLLPDV